MYKDADAQPSKVGSQSGGPSIWEALLIEWVEFGALALMKRSDACEFYFTLNLNRFPTSKKKTDGERSVANK